MRQTIDENELAKNERDRYWVGDVIGGGGYSVVHDGYDAERNVEVVIKVLRDNLEKTLFKKRYPVEAQLAKRAHQLDPDHFSAGARCILNAKKPQANERLQRAGIFDNTHPIIIVDKAPGENQLSRLMDMAQRGELSELTDVLDLAIEVSTAIGALHNDGIVHGDVTNPNIICRDYYGDKSYRVVDFGEARKTGDVYTLTNSHVLLPPEANHPFFPKKPNLDVWQLGVVMFTNLFVKSIFLKPDQGHKLVSEVQQFWEGMNLDSYLPRRMESLPCYAKGTPAYDDFTEVIGRCLKKNPKDRPRDANEVKTRLLQIKNRLAAPVA